MAGILGIGSGIDIGSIVKALVDSEKAPKAAQLDRLEKTSTNTLSAIGTLRSALAEFQTSLTALNKPELYSARTASLAPSGNLTAAATTTAANGGYALQVKQLAIGSKVALKSFVEPVQVLGGPAVTPVAFSTGTLTLSAGDPLAVGASKLVINVTAANNTQAGIRDAINAQGAAKGFSASLLTDASGTRLVISSSTLGDAKDVQVEAVDAGGGGSTAITALAFTPKVGVAPSSTTGDGGVITQASSAKITVDGLQVIRDSNTIAGVIDGVTLTLTSAQSQADQDAGKTIGLTVGQDKTGLKANLQKFVEAYNKLNATAAQLTSVVQVGEGKAPVTGPLLGDATVRGLQSSIRSQIAAVQTDGGIRALADLGITTQKDGSLKLDSAKLDTAVNTNFDKVGGYLSGDKGLISRLNGLVDGFTRSAGVLAQRQQGLQSTISGIDKQRTALDARIAKVQERLVAQYSAMDSLVARLKKTSESLASQLASLPGFVKKSN
jgi:flagellar hook-associated protein 2